MSTHKIIQWFDRTEAGNTQCRVSYLIGYCPAVLENFLKMANEVCTDIPELNASDFQCGKVYKSVWCNQFTIVSWIGYLERKDYPGYCQTDRETILTDFEF